MMARRSARQITLTLSELTADLLAARGAIWADPGKRRGISYHTWSAMVRLNCMQFEGPIAQIESVDSGGFLRSR
jgi:hypothetical protein